MKVYVCPCGPQLSIWRSHDNRYGYVISSRFGGDSLNTPVWSVPLPVTVTGEVPVALFVMEEFIQTLRKEVFSVFHRSELIPALYGNNNPAVAKNEQVLRNLRNPMLDMIDKHPEASAMGDVDQVWKDWTPSGLQIMVWKQLFNQT
jgi:hypothetical protein